MRPARHYGYKAPAIDSAAAKASAQLFLTGARTLDGVTAERLAHQYHLRPKTAEYLLTLALQRRATNG